PPAVRVDRRQFLAGALASRSLPVSTGCSSPAPRWEREAVRQPKESRVAILEARDYAGPLGEIVRRGLSLFHLSVRGKTVLLKPNFVEYDAAGVINTHPRVVAGARGRFRHTRAPPVLVG